MAYPTPQSEVAVTLTRDDFAYFNWALALERPILPYLFYTFTFLVLVSFLGLWPAGRAFVPAVFIPLLGYLFFVWLATRRLWGRLAEADKNRRYRFLETGYRVNGRETAAYREVARAIESRRGLYLLREDGSAEVLPKRDLDENLLAFLKERLEPVWKRSSFL